MDPYRNGMTQLGTWRLIKMTNLQEEASNKAAYIANTFSAFKNEQLAEALAACYEALRRSPDAASFPQLQRLLQRSQVHMTQPAPSLSWSQHTRDTILHTGL